MRPLLWLFLATVVAACGPGATPADGAAPGPQLDVRIAALSLSGVGEVVWDLEVVNGLGQVVWQRRLTSTAYGDGAGSASVVGPCDAGPGAAENTVRVWVVGLYTAPVTAGAAGSFAAGSAAGVAGTLIPYDSPTALAPLTRTVTCREGADAAVAFDVALMRPAQQGFFDVAVSFNNIFCSAKFDCCYDRDASDSCDPLGSEDIELLFDADGARARTFVLGFACTAGASATVVTELYMDALELDCDVNSDASTFLADLTLDPAHGSPGNQCTAGAVASCDAATAAAGVAADTYLYQFAVYTGEEQLTSGGVAAQKAYWNVALGVKPGISACRLRATATADDAANASDLVVNGSIAAGAVYPYVAWDVPLGSCAAEPLTFGQPGATVRTAYTGTGDAARNFTYHFGAGLPAAGPFCTPACHHGGQCGPGGCDCTGTGFVGTTCETPQCGPGYAPEGATCVPRLTSLAPSLGALAPAFDPEVFAYAVEVAPEVAALTFTATAVAPVALTIQGLATPSGTASDAVALTTGANTVTVTATDGAARSYTVIVTRLPDTTPPAAPVITDPASSPAVTATDLLTLSGTCELGATVTLAGADAGSVACADGTFSLVLAHTVDGPYDVTVTQTDAAGNASPAAAFRWVRDTVVPAPPALSAPATPAVTTNASPLTLAGSCTDGYTVVVAGASAQSTTCAAGSFSFAVSAAADDVYTYALTQQNPVTLLASTAVTVVWTLDTQPPAAPTLATPAGDPYYSAGSDLTVSGACELGATVTLGGDESAVAACPAGAFTFPLHRAVNGAYAFTVTQTDVAGNPSPSATFTWVRDDTVPAAPVVTAPAASPADTAGSQLTLAGSCTDTFTVYLQGASTQTTTCTGGTFTFTVAADVDGAYVYTLYQESAFTQLASDTTSFTWRRDTTAPDEVTVTSPPANPYFSGDDTLVIGGACETGATVALTGAETASALCVSGSYAFSVTRLVNTTYNFNLAQTDLAGNASLTVLFQWVRDNTIPPTPVVTSPASPFYSSASSVAIIGTCLATYEVSLSGADTQQQICTGGVFSFTVSAATDASRSYDLHQTNPQTFIASSATSVVWVRDTVAPAAVVFTAPAANPYASGDATFALQGLCEAGATVVLAGAQAGTQTCAVAGTFRFDLSKSLNGTYDYTVTQHDLAANASPATAFRWIRDTSIPPTPLLSSPAASPYTSNGSSLTIAGSCNGTNAVIVSGTASASAPCSGGGFSFTFNTLVDGTFNYSVAQQSAINGSFSSAAVVAWNRDTVAPSAPTLTSLTPISPSANPNPKAKGTASADTVTVELFKTANCSGAVAASGTRAAYVGATGVAVPATLQASMSVSARALDAAGNASPCSAASLSYQHRAAQLVKDINLEGNGASSPSQFGVVGSRVFFRATDGATGNELFVTDGTPAGTRRVKDINPADSSNPAYMVDFNGVALFSADDGEHGAELWKSDGTEAGTVLVADINVGPFGSAPNYFLVVGPVAYFMADDGETGAELWKTDGTDAGTVQVADLEPGFIGAAPTQLRAVGGVIVFRATTSVHGIELWKSDGTAAGTTCFDINAGAVNSSANYLVNMGAYVYFSATETVSATPTGNELYRTDGATVTRLTDLYAGSTSATPAYLAVAGSTLFFYARQYSASAPVLPGTGYELFKYTTAGGAVLVKDIVAGTGSSSPALIVALDSSRVVFRATTTAGGQEPWVSNGTAAGTVQLADINPGLTNSAMTTPVAANGKAYFAATTNGEVELWETDGTALGTVRHDLNPGTQSSSPSALVAFGSNIILSVHTLTYAREPWLIDGAGPHVLADLNLVPAGSPNTFLQYGSMLLFAADDGVHGGELWRTDGTAAGTVMVKDINPDPGAHSSPAQLTVAGSYVFFRADDGVHGSELWRTDGTEAGTVLVADIAPDEVPSTPNYLVALGSQLLFSADDGTDGIELWQVTGAGAPSRVKNIHETAATSSSPVLLTVMGSKVYFRATHPTYGAELWVTDGTLAGTVLVKNVRAGTSSSSPSNLTVVGGTKLFFTANDGLSGVELHVSDGTTAGTFRVTDLNPGTLSSSPTNLRDLGGVLLFAATEATYGRELYRSAGVANDAVLVKDIRVGAGNANPGPALILSGKAYFAAADDAAGNELWVTDGTAVGTTRVLDARPGAASSNPASLLAIDATSFFYAANEGVNGTEPWRSNRTAAGTYLIEDINLYGPGWGAYAINWNGTIFFSASDGLNGAELWKY